MNFFLDETFGDFERFAERTRAWQLDFVQLDCGNPHFELLQAGAGDLHIGRVRLGRRLLQRGGAPTGMRSFAIPAASGVDHLWRGYEVAENHLLIFPKNGELSSISYPGFDNLVVSVGVRTLERICEEEELPALDRLLGDHEFIPLPPQAIGILRRQGLAVTDALKTTGPGFPDPLFISAGEELARTLLVAIAEALEAGPLPSGSRLRSACLNAAMEMIEDCGRERLTVAEIVRATRCSERTLQYAFKEHFGIGPKAYLQAWRLNQARRELSRPPEPAIRISDIANHHGFWHMGQFAADYRRMFGELPSETWNRCRGSAAVR